jgi:hypothetical protein
MEIEAVQPEQKTLNLAGISLRIVARCERRMPTHRLAKELRLSDLTRRDDQYRNPTTSSLATEPACAKTVRHSPGLPGLENATQVRRTRGFFTPTAAGFITPALPAGRQPTLNVRFERERRSPAPGHPEVFRASRPSSPAQSGRLLYRYAVVDPPQTSPLRFRATS